MPKLDDLTESDRLLVVSGTENEYRTYLHDHILGRTPLRPDRVRRLRYIRDIRGFRGPHLYYTCIGTWDHLPFETGIFQILRQIGAEPLDVAQSNSRAHGNPDS